MVNTSVNIPWNDGSGEDLTLTIQENSSGEVDISLDSPTNLTGKIRSKKITFKDTTRYKPLDFELEIQQLAEGIGVMEIGSTFIIY